MDFFVAVVLCIKKGSTSIVEQLINLMELNLFHNYCGMHAVLYRVSLLCRYESLFIQNIVKEVGKKLSHTALNAAPKLVGIDSCVERIKYSWLQDGSSDVDIATIHGIGGIGKTAIAKTVYNFSSNNFELSSFLANVREISEQSDGLVRLQRKLLTDLLKRKENKIYSVDEGIIKIKDVVCCKRVLILDDVDQLDQFNAIIGMPEWFCPGSKIIITTRHQCLLRASEVSVMFKLS
jgi:hypothetical protein